MRAQPPETGSISSGHQIAITICGNCHEDPTSSRKTTVGPKLEDIEPTIDDGAVSKRVSSLTAQKSYAEFFSFQGRYR
jgi:cytochrome c2